MSFESSSLRGFVRKLSVDAVHIIEDSAAVLTSLDKHFSTDSNSSSDIDTITDQKYAANLPILHRRQLAGKQNYMSWNWMMIFAVITIVSLYSIKFIIIPYAKKFHHWYTRRRVTAHLDGFDEAEFEDNFNATQTHINEVGEIIYGDPEAIAKAQLNKRDEIQIMRDMLKDQQLKMLAKKYAEESKVEAELIGPDGE
jgi:hypothetical protein